MAVSDVSICSNALVRLGASGISAFTDGTPEAELAGELYPNLRDAVLGMYDWRFLVKKMQLSQLVAAPTTRWTYQYTLPPDRMSDAPLVVFNSNAVGVRPVQDFQIVGQVLMTDYSTIWVDYTADLDESFWPPYFVELMIGVCAAEFALSVTGSSTIAKERSDKVYGQGGLFMRAKARDFENHPNKDNTFYDYTLLAARHGGV